MTSKSVKVRLHLAGLNELMRSAPVQGIVTQSAHRIQASAGEEYEAVEVPHKWTARAYVQSKTYKGYKQEAKGGQLTRAVGSHAH